jgi:hypothetical protein
MRHEEALRAGDAHLKYDWAAARARTPASPMRDSVASCLELDVHLSADGRTGSIRNLPLPACGKAVALGLDTTGLGAIAMNPERILGLTVWVRNSGARPLVAPAHVSLSARDVVCPPPAGTTSPRDTIWRLPCCGHAVADGSLQGCSGAVYDFDDEHAARPMTQVLAPGHKSGIRGILFRLPPNASDVKITLRVAAAQIAPLRISPPDTLPAYLHPSARQWAPWATRHVVDLVFRDHASLTERQNAIDVISGTVIGGSRHHGGEDHYYVWLLAAREMPEMLDALDSLRRLPQVRTVLPLNFYDTSEPPAAPPRVDTTPPDTLPADLRADSAFLHGRALSHVLVLVFRPAATQNQRQLAVDRSGGTVMGGSRLGGNYGYYYIWIPDAATEAQLRTVADTLRQLPQVEGAAPFLPGGPADNVTEAVAPGA